MAISEEAIKKCLESALEENNEKILAQLDERLDSLEEKILGQIGGLMEKVDLVASEVDALKLKVFELEKRDLRKTLIVYKCPELQNKHPADQFIEALKTQMKLKPDEVKLVNDAIDLGMRLGKPNPKRPRPLKIVFYSPKMVNKLLERESLDRLKGTPNSIILSKEKPEVARRLESEFKDDIKQARQNRKKIKWVAGNLLIDGQKMASITDVPCLPPPRQSADPEETSQSRPHSSMSQGSPASPPSKQPRGVNPHRALGGVGGGGSRLAPWETSSGSGNARPRDSRLLGTVQYANIHSCF